MKRLGQSELNAAVVIRAFADIVAENTDPRFGYGGETLEMVREHLKGWEWSSLQTLRETVDRCLRGIPGADPKPVAVREREGGPGR